MPQELTNQSEIVLDRSNLEEVGEQRQVVQVHSSALPGWLIRCHMAHSFPLRAIVAHSFHGGLHKEHAGFLSTATVSQRICLRVF